MPIQSSAIIKDRSQTDGRRSIRERHTDQLGAFLDVAYIAESDTDEEAVMASRIDSLNQHLKEAEISANMAKALNAELVFTFNHSTVAENRVALRELFKNATKFELMTLGWVINELNLSDAQLKAIFGVDDSGLPALKAKLADISGKYEDALALTGQ